MNKGFGKWLSVVVCWLLYMFIWNWVINHFKSCNRNAKWEICLSRIFVALHILAIVGFMIWSWL